MPGGPGNLPFFLAAHPGRRIGPTGRTPVTHPTTTITGAQDRELKAKHRAVWALGDYPAVAADIIPELGPAVVTATGIGVSDVVLDVAAGPGSNPDRERAARSDTARA